MMTNFLQAIRKWLFAGLLVLAPLSITLWVLNWLVTTLDQTLVLLPDAWHPNKWSSIPLPGLGVLLSFCTVLMVGMLASNYMGNRLVGWWHQLLQRIPFVRSIYSGVKQVSDTLFSENGNAFRKTVLVRWPHQGMWTVGFVTGEPAHDIQNALHVTHDEWISVYIPTTPNPTGGYLVMVRRIDCIEMAMGVEEALRYVISMGVITPTDTPPTPTNPSNALSL